MKGSITMHRSLGLRAAATAAALALALTACGSSSPPAGPSPAAADTVPIDVGNGTTIALPKGQLKVGLLLQGMATSFNQSLVAGAKAEAQKYGYEVTPVDAAFDLQKQLNQIQTTASNHTYDVMAVQPLVAASECTAMTKTIPAAGILSVTIGTPCQTNVKEAGDDLWVAGTMATIAGDTTLTYTRAFFREAAKRYPGKQTVVLVTGPEIDPLVINEKKVAAELAAENPEFSIKSFVYGDWTAPTAQSKTLQYLQANPDVTVVLSAYSPDVSRGVGAALTSLGKVGTVKFSDAGASGFTVEQIKAGTIDFSLPYFPDQYGVQLIKALHAAQSGENVPRFISNVPADYGTVDKPIVVTKDNVASFTPRY
jgi:ABC-type sugar transport system substrate-binding protein